MRVLITTNSKHGLCLESVNNMLITTFVNNELITLPTLHARLSSETAPAHGFRGQHRSKTICAGADSPHLHSLHSQPAHVERNLEFVQLMLLLADGRVDALHNGKLARAKCQRQVQNLRMQRSSAVLQCCVAAQVSSSRYCAQYRRRHRQGTSAFWQQRLWSAAASMESAAPSVAQCRCNHP